MERRDFFISYTKRDKERAVWIARVLQDNGYTVYMQEMDILPGDSFLTKMNYFLENSENFIAVWSKSYNDSYYGMMELEAAVTAKMRIIFCCVDNHPVLKLYRRLVHVALPNMGAASKATLADAVRRAVPRPAHKPKTSKLVGGKRGKYARTGMWKVIMFFSLITAFLLVMKMSHMPIYFLIVVIALFLGAWSVAWKAPTATLNVLLGEFYYNRKNYSKARKYYEQAAEKGDEMALFNLGYLYFHGLGVSANYAKARSYYGQAADKGLALALNNLGYIYQFGLGVETNYTKARDYYEQAADKKNEVALYNLGWLYEYGKGVEIDYEKALDYYQKATNTGNEDAPEKVETLRKRLNAQSGE